MAGDYIHIFGPEAVTLEGSGGGEIGNDPPVAVITANDKVHVDKSIQFDGSGSSDSDGWIMNWTWNFGDGNITTTTNETITHKYSAEGIYTVNLTVTDDDGATNTDTIAVTVTVFSMDIYLPASPTRIWVKGQGVDISTITVNATSNGTPVFGVPINFSTNLGTFIESGTKFYTNTTDINGLATVTLE